MNQNINFSVSSFLIKIIQGTLIGIGAVLPGISGGVLCVVFGIYKTIMELLAYPLHNVKTHILRLFPIILGGIIGFCGIANILSFLLEKYPAPSVCVFIGLIIGMLPALYKEAGEHGRSQVSYISMYASMSVVFILLVCLKIFSVEITPNFMWYLFCGCCLALSIIAPGMSFSTLLMPLGLYEPFVYGIGHMDFNILIPSGIGGFLTIILLSKAVNSLFDNHYTIAFHAIIGIVIAATIMIIPFTSFTVSFISFVSNIVCLGFGFVSSFLLDRFNQKFTI